MNFIVVSICGLCFFWTASASKSHPITTLLNAKWFRTPICLEVAEYLADENPILYWDYIEKIHQLETPLSSIDTESKFYKSSIRAAEDLIAPAHVKLLKLSLAMHSLSPRVQAHLKIAQDVVSHGDCETDSFATIGSRVACNMDELVKGIEKLIESDNEELYAFDHIYPGTENNNITVILYSQIGTEDFQKFHELLKNIDVNKNIKYVSRHYVRKPSNEKVRLSGYGVELHLKSTEYKSQDDATQVDETVPSQNDEETEVEGFDFVALKTRLPHLSHSLDRLRSTLLEKSDDIIPLKAWEFQDLGLQSAQRIAAIQGEEALQILQFTSQNFPTQAKSLLHQEVTEDFRQEMKHNIDVLGSNLNIQPPDAAIFVNGLYFDSDTIDIGSLLETLRSELRILDGLHKLSISGSAASDLLALDFSTSAAKEFAIDIRDSAITWINDLEADHQYRRWPSSLMDLLRPTFPGMLRNVRKNLFNLVLIMDPITPNGRSILKLTDSFIHHTAPVRVGFVFDARTGIGSDVDHVYRAIQCAVNYVTQQKSSRDTLKFLMELYDSVSDDEDVTIKHIKMAMRKLSAMDYDQIDDILGEDSDYDYGRQLSLDFIERIGMKKSPQVLMNGAPLKESVLNRDDFEEAVLTEIMQQTPVIQKAVYRGDLSDSDDVVDYLMAMPHIMPRLNQLILLNEEPVFVDLSGTPHANLENVNNLLQLSNRDMTATLMGNIKYFSGKHSLDKPHVLTLWVVGDLETESGKTLLINALSYLKSSGSVRVAFIPNVEGTRTLDKTNLNRIVWAATHGLKEDEMVNIVFKWLTNSDHIDVPDSVRDLISSTELHIKMLRVYAQKVLKLKASQNTVIASGKIVGPLTDSETFTLDDFGLMERLYSLQYGDAIKKVLDKLENVEEPITSDTVLKLVTLLGPRQQSRSRFTIPADVKEHHTVVRLPPKSPQQPYFEIFAMLDPASRGAQKLSPLLILLRNVFNCNMRVVLACVEKHSDMPVKNFYRFVMEPEIQFSPDGRSVLAPYAKFIGLPASPLLTQNLQVPENWLVEVVRSVYDLDNIKLIDINGPVHSEYELEHLLLEGHCFDAATGAPPRGLQFTLGTKDEPVLVDTIVMANLGYFQLKANPGAWLLKLRHGKSEEIYDITSADGPNTVHSTDETRVIISSLRSHVLKVRVSKKPGQSNADLLGDDSDTNSGIWDSITSSFGGGSSDTKQTETINIFSVASGHLYERLLRIMMLSLLKHTKSPVKFWFLKNYLSPQFIDFLPHMAKEYHFDYELVQYKWPRWLHQQTEKQRTIWGYKILFLDVLFPLDVKKIIFVDADAIVRADMMELNTLDLGGAPYAYTPFCDSRKEMEGFRFWKQGYWRNHLQGRRYHISALYVVDLKRFRKIAAGDRLRGQYQALSQDPNSLSNLDQDLPNNMIHQVAIKSLPQEWLWCQTWCSDDQLARAKTIDLCNNPQTKEAKLTAAQRIVPEWKDYDLEIKKLMSRVEDGEMEHDGNDEYDDSVTEKAAVHDIHSEL